MEVTCPRNGTAGGHGMGVVMTGMDENGGAGGRLLVPRHSTTYISTFALPGRHGTRKQPTPAGPHP